MFARNFSNKSNQSMTVLLTMALLMMSMKANASANEIVGGVSRDIRSAVLNKHNEYRSLTASGRTPGMPKSSDMIELAWDPALERIGVDHMSRCVRRRTRDLTKKYLESSDRAMKDYQETTKIGQLEYYTTDPSMSPKQAMLAALEEFYNGYQNYSWARNRCDRLSRCSDYKQLVWSTTRYVGCAYRQCDSLSLRTKGQVSNSIYVTCYYVRSAWGGRPYRTRAAEATPCTECPSDLSQCSYDLCSKQKQPQCSVNAYNIYRSETNRLLAIATDAMDEADLCADKIGVTPSLTVCSPVAAPTGCWNCLQLLDTAVKARDTAYAMDNQKMKMQKACVAPVSVPLDAKAGTCVERLSMTAAGDAQPFKLLDNGFRGCKSTCARDDRCGCFIFASGTCNLYGSPSDCTVAEFFVGSLGGYCAH